jgi:hypothetical protein
MFLLCCQFGFGTFEQISDLCIYLDLRQDTVLLTSAYVLIRCTVNIN